MLNNSNSIYTGYNWSGFDPPEPELKFPDCAAEPWQMREYAESHVADNYPDVDADCVVDAALEHVWIGDIVFPFQWVEIEAEIEKAANEFRNYDGD